MSLMTTITCFVIKGAFGRQTLTFTCFMTTSKYVSVYKDHGSSDGGFIDFGGTEKLRKRIKQEIELQLA